MERRSFVGLLALGAIGALSGCGISADEGDGSQAIPSATVTPSNSVPKPTATGLPPIPQPRPGAVSTIFKAPKQTQQIALTVDDGFCADCVSGYVKFAQQTGIPLTFCPNGTYSARWEPHADALRPLIEANQVQIGNHTWSHLNQSNRTEQQIKDDLERNDEWVQKTFGITTRPYFRPPYGFHNATVDGVAGELGYRNILMWNGSYGDSSLLKPRVLLKLARRYLQPGTIMIGHANYPTILGLFDQIRQIIDERNLQPVTLDTMFGTSRATG